MRGGKSATPSCGGGVRRASRNKLLLAERAARYVAKANYHVARFADLAVKWMGRTGALPAG
jgi:hypothetical protein